MALILIKILGVLFAVEIFAKFTPLIDSNLYMQGALNLDAHLRTRIVGVLATFFHQISGVYITHFVFSLFSVLGLFYYYLTGGRRWALLLFLALPSSLVWTSIVGKEALFFGAAGVVIVIWSKYVLVKLSKYDLIFFWFFFLICLVLRPHYTMGLVWLIFSTFMIKKFSSNHILMMGILLTLTLFFIVIFLGYDELLRRGWGGIDPNARSSRFTHFDIIPHSESGYDKFRSMIFFGSIFGIIGPMLSETLSRIELAPFFLEGVMIFLMPLLSLFLARNGLKIHDKFFYKIFWFSLIPTILILMVIHAPFGILNPGSAVRWRVNFEQIFYFAPIILIFRFMDETKKENISLSS